MLRMEVKTSICVDEIVVAGFSEHDACPLESDVLMKLLLQDFPVVWVRVSHRRS